MIQLHNVYYSDVQGSAYTFKGMYVAVDRFCRYPLMLRKTGLREG
jgi:hypothetical protein